MLDIGNYQEFTGYESQEITENSMDTANRIVATESTSGLMCDITMYQLSQTDIY